VTLPATSTATPNERQPEPAPPPRTRSHNLGLDRFSGLYVWGALIVLFGIWVPDLFLTTTNARIVAGSQAITAIVALGLLVPVACGAFDLSIAGTLGMSVCVVCKLQAGGHPVIVSILAALVLGIAIGAVNSVIVVKLHVDSFIGTLGMSSILAAGAYWITNGQQIATGVSAGFLKLGRKQVLGLPLPVYYMIALGILLWWVLQYTPAGRYLYAVGGNPQAARLAGVRVGRITTAAFITSGLIAALAGVVLAAVLGSANPDVGTPYLLPAFSAVFLGATQIIPGRVNVLGTLVAIFLLATGVKGLQLAGMPGYVEDLFNGVALIIAVALAARTARKRG
jgi:ribose transport system permease protein